MIQRRTKPGSAFETIPTMMATSIATNAYSARKRVGGISLAGSNFATGATRPRPRTTPRIGGPSAKLASDPISYLQPDPVGIMPLGEPWAASPFGMAGAMNQNVCAPAFRVARSGRDLLRAGLLVDRVELPCNLHVKPRLDR